MAYAVGSITGGHFNPAVSFRLWAGGRFPASGLVPYVVFQILGTTTAAAITGFDMNARSAANNFGEHTPAATPCKRP
jgi:aquaporin Z